MANPFAEDICHSFLVYQVPKEEDWRLKRKDLIDRVAVHLKLPACNCVKSALIEYE